MDDQELALLRLKRKLPVQTYPANEGESQDDASLPMTPDEIAELFQQNIKGLPSSAAPVGMSDEQKMAMRLKALQPVSLPPGYSQPGRPYHIEVIRGPLGISIRQVYD